MQAIVTRQPVSGFTEMTEGSKARHGFDWERDYGAAWRECPSAFWLAPDAAQMLPEADLTHPRPPAIEPKVAEHEPAALRVENRALGAGLAILAAGPIFGMGIGIASGAPGMALGTLLLAPLTVPIGGILALLPVLVGTLVMGKLGELGQAWRHPLAWMAVGAPFGMTIAAAVQSSPKGLAIMAGVGAACAGIARIGVRWRAVAADERFAEQGHHHRP